jgi:aspartate beta-hydroxylase
MVGERAERVAYSFGALSRATLFAIASARTIARDRVYSLVDRFTKEPLSIDGETLAELVVLHLASDADLRSGPARRPAELLAWASELAAGIRDVIGHVPPIFEGCRAVLEAADERCLLSAYEQSWWGGSLDSVLVPHSRERVPVAEPWLIGAFFALARGDLEETRARAQIGQSLLRNWNVAWDKRLTLRQWHELAWFLLEVTELQRERFDEVGSTIAAPRVAKLGHPWALYKLLENVGAVRVLNAPVGAEADPLPPRFAAYVAGFATNDLGRVYMNSYPGLEAKPWHDPAKFPIVAALEANADAIAAEVLALDRGAYHPECENAVRSGAWNVMILFERGRKRDEVCSRLPVTTGIIEAHRTVRSPAGAAYVSRLAPGSRVALHRGPTNMRLRCHLGITVPSGCGIEVDGDAHEWIERRCIVFDDSFSHRVWNSAATERTVLIVDLWHPDLSDAEIALLEGMQRYGAALGESLVQYWAKNDELRIAQMET